MSVGKKRRWIALSAAVVAGLGAIERVHAGNFYWEGDNGTVWKTNTGLFGSNWSSQLTVNNDPLLLPGAGDDVFFSGLGAPSGPINTTLGQDFSIRSLTYLASNTDAVSIDGSIVNSLTIGSGGISVFGGPLGGNQITANVVVGAIKRGRTMFRTRSSFLVASSRGATRLRRPARERLCSRAPTR